MSTLKVDNIRHNSATSDAITTAADGTCTAKITGMTGGGALSHRNIIDNGDMRVAQRSAGPVAVSDGSNENYQTIDRMRFSFGNSAAGACNISQSTDAPTTLGFTKSHKTDVTTVNTTASGQQIINLFYRIEGQDLRNSGWNHLSPSSFLTLSFYFKTTKTGTSKLPVMFRTRHGTNYYYVKNVTVTDPTNWNRYTVTIPGNSNLQIDDATTTGMDFFFTYYSGPDKDTSSEGSWGSTNAYSTSESTNYFDSTSNDMFITGIQLEVGDTATSFEHRTYQDEFLRCCRYYYKLEGRFTAAGRGAGSSAYLASISTPVPLRSQPTIGTGTNSESESFSVRVYKYDGISDSTNTPTVGTRGWMAGNNHITLYQTGHSVVDDRVLNVYMGGGYIDFDSEL